ncbi:hypothetical protein [Mycolicibacterium mucogenicum]|uniref:Uncharacterized protein n=2 Tax=Mycolicibacterium mucogenicum DSM 44124 TaxID=1226753 RepID=A0A8E4R8T5_MYCMU|nr:hypothetical protein [Mycolicibacterium mucogenicum]KAB7758940.1 hypothetical protein MMUC44124_10575 [Mycolicibacterium mucogenicum DSM 44124]QPG69808.1 hypothetical protein C1S78_001865 [Mycolicibacterium mucogenicum DSM 44124]
MAMLVVSSGVCGIAHSEVCIKKLGGDVSWCPSSGSVTNLNDKWVVALTPIGLTPQPTQGDSGQSLVGNVISGRSNGRALLEAPGGSATVYGPTRVDYDGWWTVALQAGTALCNASKLCSFLQAALDVFITCIEGAAQTLYTTTAAMPTPSEIESYVETASACIATVKAMNAKWRALENKRLLTDAEATSASEELLKKLSTDSGIERMPKPTSIAEELAQVLAKVGKR